jgi:excisionase family DNA binding protein
MKKKDRRGQQLEKLVYDVAETAAILGVRPNHIYRLIARGELPAVRLGAHIRVSKAALDRKLEGPK